MTDRADMMILLRADTLEFAFQGTSLGKIKTPEAADISRVVKAAGEEDRAGMIQGAYVRLFNVSLSAETPAGESAYFERKAS